MIPACPRLMLALLPWCAAAALAQPTAPAPSKDAMERARRDAANPMRVILEAGRLQQRRRSEPAPAAAPAAAPAPPVARQAAPLPSPAPIPAPIPVPVAAPAAVAEPEPVAVAPAPEPAAAPVPAAVVEPPPAAPPTEAEVQPAPVPPVAAVSEAVVAPTLLNLVEPAIPPGVLGRVGALREVTADLSLRSDGTVAAVALAPTTPRAVARYLTQAFEQWRFAPLPEARVHRVQLVFNP